MKCGDHTGDHSARLVAGDEAGQGGSVGVGGGKGCVQHLQKAGLPGLVGLHEVSEGRVWVCGLSAWWET